MSFDLTASDSLRINECINVICRIRAETTTDINKQKILNNQRFDMQFLLADLCSKYMSEEKEKQTADNIQLLKRNKNMDKSEGKYLYYSSLFEKYIFKFVHEKVGDINE